MPPYIQPELSREIYQLNQKEYMTKYQRRSYSVQFVKQSFLMLTD